MNGIKDWVEGAPYSAALGVELVSLDESTARLRLPYQDVNSNPGQALHGGVAASLSLIGAQALTREALGPESGPWQTAGLNVNYLAAAKGEPIFAEATMLRRGKELCFVEVSVTIEQDKPIAHAAIAVRGAFGVADGKEKPISEGDAGLQDPGPMGPGIGTVPFIGARGIKVELMHEGRSRLTMPDQESNRDVDGTLHEGAALALLDTTGAMAAWAETGPGRFRASTPSIQAQFYGAAPADGLIAYSHVDHRANELFWSPVEVAGQSDGTVFLRGTVVYRILT